MDDHELENMFRTMDSFVDQDTAQYLAWDFLSNGEFELKNDKIPIDGKYRLYRYQVKLRKNIFLFLFFFKFQTPLNG